jgi:ribonucleotide reductase beta subunit family protein with ferritin-like domain
MSKSIIEMKEDKYYTEQIEYEPILDKSNRRFTLFPIKYHTLWDEYKKQEKSLWTAEEIDFSQDYKDFETLDHDTKYVIKMILAFFASMDGIVNLNLDQNLISKITINEAITTYRFQAMMEGIHNECYSLMIDNLIKDPVEKLHLFDSIKTIPSIKKIADWALRWIDMPTSIAHKIIAFACIEGILFSGAFAIIYWLKNYNGGGKIILPGLTKSNELISRDEKFHCDFACELYKLLNNKLSDSELKQIVSESVEIAKNFNIESIKCKLVGLNSNLMNQYVEFVADRLVVSLGYSKIYKSTNPFSFIDTLGMVQKTNFHESRATEYKSAHLEYITESNFKIADNDDF